MHALFPFCTCLCVLTLFVHTQTRKEQAPLLPLVPLLTF